MPDTSIQRLSLPPLSPYIRPLRNDESAALNLRFPGLPRTPAQCLTCAGKREFSWYAPGSRDPGSIGVYDCPCDEQFILHRVLLNSGVKENYQRLSWADFERLPDEVAVAATDYLTNSDAYVRSGFGLLLHGPRGTGKTLLAYLLVKGLIEQGLDCYATTFAEMIDFFAGGWRDKEERNWFNRRIRDASVLFIDDLGRERNKGQGTVGENMLEEVIRHRVGRNKPTFITTNAKPGEVEALYGGHVVSLLHECSTTVEFSGTDWRRDRASERLKSEIQQGLSRPVVIA